MKSKAPPKPKREIKKSVSKTTKQNFMEKVKIKRVKRNKKKATTKEKVLAGLGVGSTLLGGIGAVSPKSANTQFVREQKTETGTKTSKAKAALKRVFGVEKAHAEEIVDDHSGDSTGPSLLSLFGGGGQTTTTSQTDTSSADLTANTTTQTTTQTDQTETTAETADQGMQQWYYQAMADLNAGYFGEPGSEGYQDRLNAINAAYPEGAAASAPAQTATAPTTTAPATTVEPVAPSLAPITTSAAPSPDTEILASDTSSVPADYNGIQANNADGTFTDGAGITHTLINGQWVADAGQEKLNPGDGQIYISDGQGGWTLKAAAVTSPSTEDLSSITDINGIAANSGDGTFVDASGVVHNLVDNQWIAQAGQEKYNPEDGQTYISNGDGSWTLKQESPAPALPRYTESEPPREIAPVEPSTDIPAGATDTTNYDTFRTASPVLNQPAIMAYVGTDADGNAINQNVYIIDQAIPSGTTVKRAVDGNGNPIMLSDATLAAILAQTPHDTGTGAPAASVAETYSDAQVMTLLGQGSPTLIQNMLNQTFQEGMMSPQAMQMVSAYVQQHPDVLPDNLQGGSLLAYMTGSGASGAATDSTAALGYTMDVSGSLVRTQTPAPAVVTPTEIPPTQNPPAPASTPASSGTQTYDLSGGFVAPAYKPSAGINPKPLITDTAATVAYANDVTAYQVYVNQLREDYNYMNAYNGWLAQNARNLELGLPPVPEPTKPAGFDQRQAGQATTAYTGNLVTSPTVPIATTPTTISLAPGITFTNTSGGTMPRVGDNWQITVRGPAGQPVYATDNEGNRTLMGTIGSDGKLILSGTFSSNDVGSWTEHWSIGSDSTKATALPDISFQVQPYQVSGPTTITGSTYTATVKQNTDGTFTVTLDSGVSITARDLTDLAQQAQKYNIAGDTAAQKNFDGFTDAYDQLLRADITARTPQLPTGAGAPYDLSGGFVAPAYRTSPGINPNPDITDTPGTMAKVNDITAYQVYVNQLREDYNYKQAYNNWLNQNARNIELGLAPIPEPAKPAGFDLRQAGQATTAYTGNLVTGVTTTSTPSPTSPTGSISPTLSFTNSSGGPVTAPKVGENWQITVRGTPGQPVYASKPDGSDRTLMGTIGANGQLVLAGTFTQDQVGVWNEVWTIGSDPTKATLINNVNFEVKPVAATTTTITATKGTTYDLSKGFIPPAYTPSPGINPKPLITDTAATVAYANDVTAYQVYVNQLREDYNYMNAYNGWLAQNARNLELGLPPVPEPTKPAGFDLRQTGQATTAYTGNLAQGASNPATLAATSATGGPSIVSPTAVPNKVISATGAVTPGTGTVTPLATPTYTPPVVPANTPPVTAVNTPALISLSSTVFTANKEADLTINGANFDPKASFVEISYVGANGQRGSFSTGVLAGSTATALKVKLPALQANTYQVKVTNTTNLKASNPLTFVVVAATVETTGTGTGGTQGTDGSTGGTGGKTVTAAAAEEAYKQTIASLNQQIANQHEQITRLSQQLNAAGNNNPVLANQINTLVAQNIQLQQQLQQVRAAGPTGLVKGAYVFEGLKMPPGYPASEGYFEGLKMPPGYPASEGYTAEQETLGTYTVKKGDTLWNIAKKYYGDGRKWRKILEANTSKVKSPKTLKVGTQLVIPKL